VRLDVDGADAAVRTAGAVVPPGRDRVRFTLEVPRETEPGVLRLQLHGRATTAAGEVVRAATPADDAMQAFLWRHLVPAREWLLWVAPAKGRVPPIRPARSAPVEIPAGGSAVVRFEAPRWILERGVDLSLIEAPDGLSIANVTQTRNQVRVTLAAAPGKLPAGFCHNLILGAAVKPQGATAKTGAARARSAAQAIVLPALPVTITAPAT